VTVIANFQLYSPPPCSVNKLFQKTQSLPDREKKINRTQSKVSSTHLKINQQIFSATFDSSVVPYTLVSRICIFKYRPSWQQVKFKFFADFFLPANS
jgi:hypothetical protein